MSLNYLRLKPSEDRRLRAGHPWIFSNEIDTKVTPLKTFTMGEQVLVEAHNQTILGVAYVNPHSLITGRIFSTDPDTRLDKNFFRQKLQTALLLREQLFAKPYYRLVFSEGDYLPGIIIDRFAHDFVVQINTAGMEQQKDNLVAALIELFPQINSILLRNDSPIREHEQLEKYIQTAFGSPPNDVLLEENQILFIAPLISGQKTGWFYDHRFNRDRLRAYVSNRLVLDVFSYVGSFGIQAAQFGAKEVTCIESSELSCSYIRKNAVNNQVNEQVTILCEDAFAAMKNLIHQGKQFEVIILDPPAFVKKQKDRKEGIIAYQRLNELALKLLTANGVLISCSCSMHVAIDDLLSITQRAALRTQSKIQLLERGHQGADHPIHPCIPETDYLKALFLRKV